MSREREKKERKKEGKRGRFQKRNSERSHLYFQTRSHEKHVFAMATSFASNVRSSSSSCTSSCCQSRRFTSSSAATRRSSYLSSLSSFQRSRIGLLERTHSSVNNKSSFMITSYIEDESKRDDNKTQISKYYQTVELPRVLTITNSTAASGGGFLPEGEKVRAPSPKFIIENALMSFMNGINQRLEADKNFVFKLLAEICIDELITLSVLIWVTGLDAEAWTPTIRLAALVQMLSAALNDTLIVYFLAPTSSSVEKDGISGGKPALAHVFQAGDYSMKERITCYFKKAKFYLVIGGTTCTVATFFAKALGGNLAGFFPGVFVQSIMLGGIHMSVSANTRYQIVNGIERLIYEKLPPKVSRACSVLIRTSNNFLGARLWIVLTKLISS